MQRSSQSEHLAGPSRKCSTEIRTYGDYPQKHSSTPVAVYPVSGIDKVSREALNTFLTLGEYLREVARAYPGDGVVSSALFKVCFTRTLAPPWTNVFLVLFLTFNEPGASPGSPELSWISPHGGRRMRTAVPPRRSPNGPERRERILLFYAA